MSILADFFVSLPEQALQYASSPETHAALKPTLQPFEASRLTSLEMGTLWAIMDGAGYDPGTHVLEDVQWGEGNESWLHRFPDAFVALLAGLDERSKTAAAEAWAQTEELQCSPSDVQPVLAQLHGLADRQMRSNGESLYLWGCV